MQIEVKIDPDCQTPKIVIVVDKISDEVNRIMAKLDTAVKAQVIAGFREDEVAVLDPADIYQIFTQAGKVYAATDAGNFCLRLRLYEVEEMINNQAFARISNTDIINLKKVKCFDFSFTGTIYVKLTNGRETYVSRRYVGKIKDLLGIGGNKK